MANSEAGSEGITQLSNWRRRSTVILFGLLALWCIWSMLIDADGPLWVVGIVALRPPAKLIYFAVCAAIWALASVIAAGLFARLGIIIWFLALTIRLHGVLLGIVIIMGLSPATRLDSETSRQVLAVQYATTVLLFLWEGLMLFWLWWNRRLWLLTPGRFGNVIRKRNMAPQGPEGKK